MTHRSKILLTILFVIICFGILAVLLLLNTFNLSKSQRETPEEQTPNTGVPTSFPVSYSELPGDEKFKFIALTDADTVVGISDEGQIPLELDQFTRKSLKRSPDSTKISLLAEDSQDVWNIYVYDIPNANWKKYTNLNKAGEGVTSYLWKSDDEIIFMQGVLPEKWLHSLKLSQNEVIKLNKVDGELYEYNSGFKKITFVKQNANSTSFFVATEDGQLIYKFEELRNNAGESVSSFRSVTVLPDENIFMQDSKLNLYTSIFGSREIVEVEDQSYDEISLLCTYSDNLLFSGLDKVDSKSVILQFDFELNSFVEIASLDDLSLEDVVEVNCGEDNLFIKLTDEGEGLRWFNLVNGTVEEVTEFSSFDEVVYLNL